LHGWKRGCTLVGNGPTERISMYKKYVVRLTEKERSQLETLLVRSGRAHARRLLYARILLKADADGPDQWTDERIAEAFEVSTATAARQRRRFCEDGLEVALMPKKPGRPRRRGCSTVEPRRTSLLFRAPILPKVGSVGV
jgi:hypothetical protein